MRYISVTKDQFDDFLYPAYARVGSENEDELEISIRLKFKFRKIAKAEEISKERLAKAQAQGEKLYALLKMTNENEEIVLEEDEHKLLLKRFRLALPSFADVAVEEVHEILNLLKDPPKVPEPSHSD